MLVSVLRAWARPRQVQFNRPLRDTPESPVLGRWGNELSMKVAEPWRPAHAALDRMMQVPVHTLAETDAVMLVRSAAKIAIAASRACPVARCAQSRYTDGTRAKFFPVRKRRKA
jgi:hypothetical protein